jgi:DNA-binding XRE family transcriptional regulator
MIQKRTTKRKPKATGEVARLRQLRNDFQKRRPSLQELVDSGDYTAPVPQSELLMVLALAAELKKARTQRRLSLATVAKRCGIDKDALSRIENGRNTDPSILTLETIARSIGARLTFQLETH